MTLEVAAMNNRQRLARKTEKLPGIRQIRVNELAAMHKEADDKKEQRAYAEELDLRKSIVVKTKKVYGDVALEAFDAMSDLAFTYQRVYRFDEALAIRKDTLNICQILFGEYHRATAMAMYFMANTLNAMGKYRKALAYDYKTYTYRLGLLGTEDIDTIRAAVNLAASYADIGDYKTSLFYLKKAQEYVSEIYDEDNAEINEESLDITVRIAIILDDLEEYDEALELYEQVEKEYEKRYGIGHINTLEIIRRLSLVLSHQGKHEIAKSNLKNLLTLEKLNFGMDDYETLWTVTGLACVLDRLGEHEEGKKLHEYVLNKKRDFYGKKHPAYIIALANWVQACHETADIEQGSGCVKELEQALADGLIENAKNKICIYDVLIQLYIDTGEYNKAAELAVHMIEEAEYHYYYKKRFLANRYDTVKLACEKAGDLNKVKEYEYKKTHMDQLIYGGKPLCGMKLKAKKGDGLNLTEGKIYELLHTKELLGETMYAIIDDEEFGPYLYAPDEFEVVEEREWVTRKQKVTLCESKQERVSICVTASLIDGKLIISGQDTGDAPEEFWGDSDYEYWLTIPATDTKKLFNLLCADNPDADPMDVLQNRFHGESAFSSIREFCQRHGINAAFDSHC